MPLLGLVAIFLTCSAADAQPNRNFAEKGLSHYGLNSNQVKLEEGRAIVIHQNAPVGEGDCRRNPGVVYVTGKVHTSGEQPHDDIVVLKVHACTIQLIQATQEPCPIEETWPRTYNGAGNGDDAGNAIGLDQDGAVYVAGTVQGTSSKDMVVLKYAPDGDLKWARTYDRSGLEDRAAAMVITPQGHCYVAGYTTSGERSNKDMTVIKVMPDGSLDWAKHATFGGSAALDDLATCIAIGGNYLFAAGEHRPGGTAVDIGVMRIKLDNPDSVDYFVFDGNGSGVDWANAVVANSAGEVYVAGRSYYSSTRQDDYVVFKLNTSMELSSSWSSGGGQPQGVRYYNGAQNGNDEILAMAIDAGGNVVVTGRAVESDDDPADITTIRYTAGGDVVSGWPHVWDRSAEDHFVEEARSITVDSQKNVYVAGLSVANSSGSNWDIVCYKLKPNGGPVGQVLILDGPEEGKDYANAVAVDDLQRCYVTGSIDMGGSHAVQAANVGYFTVPLFADANEDDCVDDADLALVTEEFGQQGSGLAGDVNGDGIVDDNDMAIVLTNFGLGCCD